MGKPVNGYLASDGTFFEREPECKRHEVMQTLEGLCESHGTNFEAFLICITMWATPIKEFYDADGKCEQKQEDNYTVSTGDDSPKPDDEFDESLLRDTGYPANAAIGDKNAPGFLEQQIRKHK